MGEMHTIFWIENLKERDHLETRHRWEYDDRMDLRKIGVEGVDWIHLAQSRYQCQAHIYTVTNSSVP